MYEQICFQRYLSGGRSCGGGDGNGGSDAYSGKRGYGIAIEMHRTSFLSVLEQWTDQWVDRPMDRPSYGDAYLHLKKAWNP